LRDVSLSQPANEGHPSPATQRHSVSPAQLPGEFGLVWHSPWVPLPGFHPGLCRASTWSFPARCEDSLLLLFTAFFTAELGGPGGTRTLGLLNAIETRSQLRHGPRQRDGAEGIRTPDLYSAIVALSQLSYSPTMLSLFYPRMNRCQGLTRPRLVLYSADFEPGGLDNDDTNL
jgi:hypothetical protein